MFGDELLPPQIQVGTYQHTLDVSVVESPPFIQVILKRPKSTLEEERMTFLSDEADSILPWLAEAGAK
jgi:hypothetical protein